MHLAVEASALTRNLRGMGRYTRCLLGAMPKERPSIRYTLVARNAADVALLRQQVAALAGVLERSVIVPASEMHTIACDAAWYPCNFVTRRPASGAIVPTVHDLFPMLQLDHRWWKIYKRTRARMRYASAMRAADHVITGASAAAAELRQRFALPDECVSVVPHAADDFRAADPASADRILATLGVTGAFLLAVGSQEPRKNLAILYAAMRLLGERGNTVPLVLCGPRGVHGFRPGDTVPSWLKHAGFVTDDELAALYARATALVFPSRYEGFGLPVLEAMTVGGAVICADASTMPEVGGDAVLYFPPDDAAALAAQIERIIAEPALREHLVLRGAQQAARYSWSRSAAGTLAAIDRGIAAHRQRR
jgi:glycosyltransferase involved in cell wall biosynthesis